MTINEFKAWLDGYVEAEGNDINRVKEKLNEIVAPFEVPGVYPIDPCIRPMPTYPWTVTTDPRYPWITSMTDSTN